MTISGSLTADAVVAGGAGAGATVVEGATVEDGAVVDGAACGAMFGSGGAACGLGEATEISFGADACCWLSLERDCTSRYQRTAPAMTSRQRLSRKIRTFSRRLRVRLNVVASGSTR